MNADRVRELVARREDTDLDFKVAMFNWDADGNLELAKDLMAIANKLGPRAAPAYILIGVEEVEPEKTGRIVGIDESHHLDDAKMHDKVKHLLNRVPDFSYSAVVVDSLSVGVFEIRPGGRPFYPLNRAGSRHRLERFQPMCRVGTATDIASPEMVIAWSQEDDPTELKLKALELEERENKLSLHARVLTPGTRNTAESSSLEFDIVNDGEAPFRIGAAAMHWRVDTNKLHRWLRENHARLVGSDPQPLIVPATFPGDTVRAGNTVKVTTTSTVALVDGHFQQFTSTEGTHPSPPYWTFVAGYLEVELHGNAVGRRRVIVSDTRAWKS